MSDRINITPEKAREEFKKVASTGVTQAMNNMRVEQWFRHIKDFNDTFVDMPDGAFFALAEDRGITVDDWAWFADECKKRGTYK